METVEDIVRQMREKIKTSDGSAPVVDALMSAFIDRLDAAYKRDLKAMVDAGEIDMRTAMGEVAKLREENERLKAALKPIIDFRPEIVGNYGEEEAWDPDGMMEAMVESQRIYNGGEA